jgi:hypothetical protein
MHSGKQPSSRPRSWDRRQLLRVGCGALAGLTLPRLLWAESLAAARAAATPGAGRGRRPTARSCIFIIASGGLTHIDTLDPKPEAPAETRGPYRPISTSVPGVHVSEMLPGLARTANRCTLLRSMSHGDTVHVTAVHTMLTGQSDGSSRNNSPFLGSLVSMLRPSQAAVPSYVWLHNMKTGTNKVPRYESGLNVVGYQHAPLRIGYELDNPSAEGFRVRVFDPPEGLSLPRLASRQELLRRMELGAALDHQPAVEQYRAFEQRAWDLVTGPAARQAFELQREPESLRDRYGRHPIGQYLLMARRLIEAGVRLVTVTAWPGLAPGETQPTITQVWDTHDDRYAAGDSMFGNGPFGMKWALPRLDQGVSALLEDLDERGLLDETLVVLVTEFGRTPKFEGRGRGRGHWPSCYSGLLAGGGIRRGAVYGASDRQGAYVAQGQPVSHVDFAATVLTALGIPPDTRYGPDGFSLRVNAGQPLMELFG